MEAPWITPNGYPWILSGIGPWGHHLQPVVRGIDLEAVAELAETADDAEVGWEGYGKFPIRLQ